jgi:hypothetical protein
MTPKEKAKELVKRYACLNRGESVNDWIDRDIIFNFIDLSCALIAVDELIYETQFEVPDIRQRWWIEVKNEIELL